MAKRVVGQMVLDSKVAEEVVVVGVKVEGMGTEVKVVSAVTEPKAAAVEQMDAAGMVAMVAQVMVVDSTRPRLSS